MVENIIKAENLSSKEYKEKIMRKDEFMDDDTLYAIKKYNLKVCYDIEDYNDLTNLSLKNIMINH